MKTNLSFQKNVTTNLFWRTFALNMLICLVFSVSKLVAQSFNPLQTNPFGLATDYDIKAPCLVDIDNDGDQDLFAISQYGAILYYWENIGTASAPAYGSMQQNPFGIMMGGDEVTIQFVKIDNGSTYDLVTSNNWNELYYFLNVGSTTLPDFTNSWPLDFYPFGLGWSGNYKAFNFADLNGDSKIDLITNDLQVGMFTYYENIGGAGSHYFQNMGNPAGMVADYVSTVHLADMDFDGDMDLIGTNANGDFIYFKNSGSASAPNFDTPQTNPFGLTNLSAQSVVAVSDIDNNNVVDLFALKSDMNFYYFDGSCLPSPPTDATAAGLKSICNGTSTTLTVSSASSNIRWYDASTGGNLLDNGLNFTTPNLTSTTSYFVQDSNSCGASSRTEILVQIKGIPSTPTASVYPICPNTTIEITATGDIGGSITWWSDMVSGTLLNSGANFTTPSLTQNTTYYLKDSTCGGVSEWGSVTVDLYSNPVAPTDQTDPTFKTACFGTTTTISATGDNISFWTASIGGTRLGGAYGYASWTTPAIIADSTIFYAQDSTCGGISLTRTPIMITFPAAPAAPTILYNSSDLEVCPGEQAKVVFIGQAGASLWDAPTGGNYLGAINGIGEVYTPAITSSPTYFYAQDTVCGSASSSRTQVTVIFPAAPGAPFAAYLLAPVCIGEQATIQLLGNGLAGFSLWDAASGGNSVGSNYIFGGQWAYSTIKTPAINSDSIYFYAQDSVCGSASTSRAQVLVRLKTFPQAPDLYSNYDKCFGNPVNMYGDVEPNSNDNSSVSWWTDTINGTFLGHSGVDGLFTSPNLAMGVNTFYAKDSTCMGVSAWSSYDAIVEPTATPYNTTTSNNMVSCPGGTTTLYGGSTNTDKHFTWWTDSIGGTKLGSGTSFSTPTINTQTTFWLQDSACGGVTSRIPITVTIKNSTNTPVVGSSGNGLTACMNSTASVYGVSNESWGSLSWWSDSVGGTMLSSNVYFTTPNLTTATTYWLQDSTCGGVSVRVPATITIRTITITNQPQGGFIYAGYNHNFNLATTGYNLTYQWQKNGVNLVVAQATWENPNFTFSSLSDSGDYRCIITDGCENKDTTNVAHVSMESAPYFVDGVNGLDYSWYGTSWSQPFKTISYALYKASTSGAKVFVKKGTYNPNTDENYNLITDTTHNQDLTFRIKSGVKMYGGFAGTEAYPSERVNFGHGETNETILEAAKAYYVSGNQYHSWHVVKFLNTDSTTKLDGFTITKGDGYVPTVWGGWPYQPSDLEMGAGIYNKADGAGNTSSPTITNCYIYDNHNGDLGTGLLNWATNSGVCNPVITKCTFYHNTGYTNKGAGSCTYTTLSGSSSPTFTDCKYINNAADADGSAFENWAENGSINATYTNFQISGSTSHRYIGGMGSLIVNGNGTGGTTNVTLTNGVISKNDTYSSSQGDQIIWNGNSGTTTNIYNTIVWDNAWLALAPLTLNGSTINVYNSAIQDYLDADTSHHNLDGVANTANANYPMFLNPNGKVFKLQEGSPCLDAGLNSANTLANDLAGNTRIQNGTIDMGAYEGAYPACPTDTTKVTQHACDYSTITIDGVDYTTDATVYQTFANVNGCDSIVETKIYFQIQEYSGIDTTISCAGSTITIGGINFSNAGNYDIDLKNIYGCDSVFYELTITISGAAAGLYNTTLTQCDGASVILNADYGAMNFYGKWEDIVKTPTINDLASSSKFTFEVNVYSAVEDTSIAFGIANSSYMKLTNKSILFQKGDDQFSATFAALDPKKWHHVAFVFDGTVATIADNYKMYIDGALAALTVANGSINIGSISSMADNIYIGSAAGDYDYWIGKMKNVRIWKEARTQSQITANMSKDHIENGGSNFIAEYLFNQTSGSIVQNTSGTGSTYDFALGTMGWWSWQGKDTVTAWNNQTYAWSDGVTNGDIVTLTANQIYTVTITEVSSGCSIVDTQYVVLNPVLVPVISGTLTYCEGSSTTLDAGNYENYSWSDGSNGQTVSATISNNPYSVTVTDLNGCVGTATDINVAENPLPIPTISGNLDYCVGLNTILDAGSFVTYLWSNGSTVATTDANSANNPYSVAVIDANGCSGTSADVNVVEHDYPVVNLGEADTLCSNFGEIAILDASNGGMTYLWNDNSTNQTLEVNSTSMLSGNYDYFVSVSNGVCSTTDTITITVDICSGLNSAAKQILTIYPNPSTGVINITSSIENEQPLELFNSMGQIVYKGILLGKQSINLSDYSNGIYTVKIGNDENSFYQKIVKE